MGMGLIKWCTTSIPGIQRHFATVIHDCRMATVASGEYKKIITATNALGCIYEVSGRWWKCWLTDATSSFTIFLGTATSAMGRRFISENTHFTGTTHDSNGALLIVIYQLLHDSKTYTSKTSSLMCERHFYSFQFSCIVVMQKVSMTTSVQWVQSKCWLFIRAKIHVCYDIEYLINKSILSICLQLLTEITGRRISRSQSTINLHHTVR